jgi:hypothetical protein
MSINNATPQDWDRLRKQAPAIEEPLMQVYLDMADAELNPFDDEEKENSIDEAMAKSHYWANSKQEDVVNSPNHYNTGSIECIEGIQASMSTEAFAGYLKGNCIKYLWRYDYKGKPVEDLQKAQWYLAELIKELLFEEEDD